MVKVKLVFPRSDWGKLPSCAVPFSRNASRTWLKMGDTVVWAKASSWQLPWATHYETMPDDNAAEFCHT
jgi:hypothetical protein